MQSKNVFFEYSESYQQISDGKIAETKPCKMSYEALLALNYERSQLEQAAVKGYHDCIGQNRYCHILPLVDVSLEDLLIDEVVESEDQEMYYADQDLSDDEIATLKRSLKYLKAELKIIDLSFEEEFYEDTSYADTSFVYQFEITYEDGSISTRYLSSEVYGAPNFSLIEEGEDTLATAESIAQ